MQLRDRITLPDGLELKNLLMLQMSKICDDKLSNLESLNLLLTLAAFKARFGKKLAYVIKIE